jgi:hypothetical protein
VAEHSIPTGGQDRGDEPVLAFRRRRDPPRLPLITYVDVNGNLGGHAARLARQTPQR